MPWDVILFYLIAGISVLTALGVVAARNPMHSGIFLVLCFVNVAGIFVMLGAEFLAVIQIIVYTGAVLVLLVFVMMLVDPEDLPSFHTSAPLQRYLSFLLGLVLLLEVGAAILTRTRFEHAQPARGLLATVLAIIGVAVVYAGLREFKKASTTVHPQHPGEASSVVTTGIYRFTRNPMYLGMLLTLLAWLAYLANVAAVIVPIAFVLYIARYQIRPEERILTEKFGPPYEAYLQSVRRWI